MIDEIYNSRIGAIKTDRNSEEWEQTAIPFEESLTKKQIVMFHKLCDLQSETAAAESCVQGRLQGRRIYDARGSGITPLNEKHGMPSVHSVGIFCSGDITRLLRYSILYIAIQSIQFVDI